MLLSCPDCHGKLHEGQHRFADGLFQVQYCKGCGFRKEVQEGQSPSAQKGKKSLSPVNKTLSFSPQ